MRAHLIVFLLFSSFALAATTFSTNQKTEFQFVFRSANTSSVFVHFPQAWDSVKSSSDFTCPANWFRDADFQGKVHCACAAPCRSFLSEGNVSFNTHAPNVSGNYTWIVLAYDDTGSLVYNASPSLLVQTSPALLLSVQTSPIMVSDDKLFIQAVLENKGQATAENINFSLKVHTPDEEEVTPEYAFSTPQTITLEGGQNFLFNVTLSSVSAKTGERVVALGGAGADVNSKNTVRASATKLIQVKTPARIGIFSIVAPAKVSEGQEFNASVLLKNAGGVGAQRVNVSVYATTLQDSKLAGSAAFESMDPGGFRTLAVKSVIREAGNYSLTPEVSYVEQFSGRLKGGEQTPLAASLLVQKPPKLVLDAPAPLETIFTTDNFTIKTVLKNVGQASAFSTALRLAKAIGGCELADVKEKPVGSMEADRSDAKEWVFATPDEGGRCKLFFQATGLGENSGEAVVSQTAVAEVVVNARKKASFDDLNVRFYEKDGEWYVVKPVSLKGWDVELGVDSELKLLVQKVVKKQDELEARLASLQLKLEAKATQLEQGSRTIRSEVTVDLVKPPSPEASVVLRILPPTAANLPAAKNVSGFLLKKPLALVKVDKKDLQNKEDVQSANVVLEVEKRVVDENGGPDGVRMLREDDGAYAILPTRLLNESASTYTFEAFSPDGLSLFALYSVEQLVPEEKTSKRELVLSQFYQKGYVAILLAILLVGVFIIIRLKNQPPKRLHRAEEKEKPAQPELPPWEKHKMEKAKNLPEDV